MNFNYSPEANTTQNAKCCVHVSFLQWFDSEEINQFKNGNHRLLIGQIIY